MDNDCTPDGRRPLRVVDDNAQPPLSAMLRALVDQKLAEVAQDLLLLHVLERAGR